MQQDFTEILIDGSPHPAAAFQEPRAKWRAHLRYSKDARQRFSKVADEAEEALRQVLLKRSAIEKTEKPSDEAQKELIDAFNPMHHGDNIEYWRHGVIHCGYTAEEALADAIEAMDNIAEKLRLANRNVSFVRQRARRARLETASAQVENRYQEFLTWASQEKEAMKKACPDFDRLSPKFIVHSSSDPDTPPGTVTTL
jgi:hypothetical protein